MKPEILWCISYSIVIAIWCLWALYRHCDTPQEAYKKREGEV